MISDGVRYRKLDKNSKLDQVTLKQIEKQITEQSEEKELKNLENFHKVVDALRPERDTYHLTRIVLLRYLAFIYLVAFVIAYNQNIYLIGKNGLLPANKFMDKFLANSKIQVTNGGQNEFLSSLEQKSTLFFQLPTLFWFFKWSRDIDQLLNLTSLLGIGLSALVLILGAANSFIMLALWLLYHSIINIGQTWYSFGWESQLVESGFIAVFLVPLISLKQVNPKSPPSVISMYIYRWLISRIMIGAVNF